VERGVAKRWEAAPLEAVVGVCEVRRRFVRADKAAQQQIRGSVGQRADIHKPAAEVYYFDFVRITIRIVSIWCELKRRSMLEPQTEKAEERPTMHQA
jgi:hypothetical protein